MAEAIVCVNCNYDDADAVVDKVRLASAIDLSGHAAKIDSGSC